MVLHPVRFFRALNDARRAQERALERIDAVATRGVSVCRDVCRKAAEKVVERESGLFDGPWIVAKPLPPRGVRGGSLPADE